MSTIEAIDEKNVPTVDKETKVVALDDLSGLGSESLSTSARAGSIYTIVGSESKKTHSILQRG